MHDTSSPGATCDKDADISTHATQSDCAMIQDTKDLPHRNTNDNQTEIQVAHQLSILKTVSWLSLPLPSSKVESVQDVSVTPRDEPNKKRKREDCTSSAVSNFFKISRSVQRGIEMVEIEEDGLAKRFILLGGHDREDDQGLGSALEELTKLHERVAILERNLVVAEKRNNKKQSKIISLKNDLSSRGLIHDIVDDDEIERQVNSLYGGISMWAAGFVSKLPAATVIRGHYSDRGPFASGNTKAEREKLPLGPLSEISKLFKADPAYQSRFTHDTFQKVKIVQPEAIRQNADHFTDILLTKLEEKINAVFGCRPECGDMLLKGLAQRSVQLLIELHTHPSTFLFVPDGRDELLCDFDSNHHEALSVGKIVHGKSKVHGNVFPGLIKVSDENGKKMAAVAQTADTSGPRVGRRHWRTVIGRSEVHETSAFGLAQSGPRRAGERLEA
ncbi:hypothetical protein ANO11243_061550 [Dothideomycetidae sp. 11243]|nr:hypothetical protein ANO11243_061550 [fungal sp. No.11243]